MGVPKRYHILGMTKAMANIMKQWQGRLFLRH